MSKTVAAADLEGHVLEVLDEVTETQQEVVILKDGKPVGKLVPFEARQRRHRTLEELRGSVTILGDIVEPIDDEWDSMK